MFSQVEQVGNRQGRSNVGKVVQTGILAESPLFRYLSLSDKFIKKRGAWERLEI